MKHGASDDIVSLARETNEDLGKAVMAIDTH